MWQAPRPTGDARRPFLPPCNPFAPRAMRDPDRPNRWRGSIAANTCRRHPDSLRAPALPAEWRCPAEPRIIAPHVTRSRSMLQFHRLIVLLPALALAVWAGAADAQWVFLARRAVGRIEQMSQKAPDGKTAFDTATVIVDVPAARVYETVQKSLQAVAGITIISDDAPTRRVEFTD